MNTPSAWQGILDDNEEILWQGRPDGAVIWKPSNFLTLIFGLFFSGFALFWMMQAAKAGGVFWMFGLIHFTAGLSIAIGPPFYSAWRRRHTWYTLTDRRAFIATDMPVLGRKLESYPIDASTILTYQAGDPATLYFAKKTKRGKNGTYTVDVGFERILDGADVYRQFRQIQKADT